MCVCVVIDNSAFPLCASWCHSDQMWHQQTRKIQIMFRPLGFQLRHILPNMHQRGQRQVLATYACLYQQWIFCYYKDEPPAKPVAPCQPLLDVTDCSKLVDFIAPYLVGCLGVWNTDFKLGVLYSMSFHIFIVYRGSLWSNLNWDHRDHIIPVGLQHWRYRISKIGVQSGPIPPGKRMTRRADPSAAHLFIRCAAALRGASLCSLSASRLWCAQPAGWRRTHLTCSPLTDGRRDLYHTEAGRGEASWNVWRVINATRKWPI